MKPTIIALAFALVACGPEKKKISAADAEKELRESAAEVVRIEYQLAAETSPGMVSLLTERLREAKDQTAKLSQEYAGDVKSETIIANAQNDIRVAHLKESIENRKGDENRRLDAAGARLEAARESARQKNSD